MDKVKIIKTVSATVIGLPACVYAAYAINNSGAVHAMRCEQNKAKKIFLKGCTFGFAAFCGGVIASLSCDLVDTISKGITIVKK
jgi:hypothetical protein